MGSTRNAKASIQKLAIAAAMPSALGQGRVKPSACLSALA
jgi:hypothetical protein